MGGRFLSSEQEEERNSKERIENESGRRCPAPFSALHEEQGQTAAENRKIEKPAAVDFQNSGFRTGQECEGHGASDGGDGQIDPKNGTPREDLSQVASNKRSQDQEERAAACNQPRGLPSPFRREKGGKKSCLRRENKSGADALKRARADQEFNVWAEAAKSGCDRKQSDA